MHRKYDREIKEIEKLGLFKRDMAIDKEDEIFLSDIEGKPRKKEKYVCLYCGLKSDEESFLYIHQCESPMVVLEKKWPMPTRPIRKIYFEIKYNSKIYRFQDYESAMLFRRLLWIIEVPLQTALKHKDLKWW
jgi:hypothetical protein